MRKKRNDCIIVFIALIVIGINTISFSKYDYIAEANVTTEIAKVVLILEKDNEIKQQIDKNSFPIEYNFVIHNYKGELVNEVNFNYQIEVQPSSRDFPVSYVLYDCDNNCEIKLSEGKSEVMKLAKNNKETRKFKVCLQWRDVGNLSEEEVKINLKVKGVQIKEENV